MKTTRLFAAIVLIIFGMPLFAQTALLPDVNIYNLDGSTVKADALPADGQVLVILFWNSENRESLEQVKQFNDEYQEEISNKNIRIIGICTDCPGSIQKIRPLVNGIELDFDIYIDHNNDLKRAMNIPQVPFTLVLNPVNDIYRHQGYRASLEDLVNDEVLQGLARNNEAK